jgi:hypothetical protein
MDLDNKWLLLYDNECSTCIKFAQKADLFASSDLVVIPLQEYITLHNDLNYDDLMRDIHLLGPDNEVYQGAEALEKVLLLFPVLKPFQWLINSSFGKKSSKVVYTSISHFHRCRKCT